MSLRLRLIPRALLVPYLVLVLSGCDWCIPLISSPDEVDVREVFLAAVRSPETFDEEVDQLSRDSDTPMCLDEKAQAAFDLEQQKLQECSQLLTGSPAWDECHDEAEAIHNHGVVLMDVARTLRGEAVFETSSSGQYLLITKGFLGPAEYEAFIDQLSGYVPDMTCEYGC